jgi:hypothetical protein
MAANKIVTLGPITLTTSTTTNIWQPPTTTGGINLPENVGYCYYIIRHIWVGNKTGAQAKVCLFKSTTGDNSAGREIVFPGAAAGGALSQGVTVQGNQTLHWIGALRLDALDTNKFIVGGSDTASALTIEAEAEMGIS